MSFRRKFLRQNVIIGGKPWSAKRGRMWLKSRAEAEAAHIARAEARAVRVMAAPAKKNWLGRIGGMFHRRITGRRGS